MIVSVQCDMGCAAAVMAWSSPDRGFAKVHMTTEAPSILLGHVYNHVSSRD